MNTKLALALAAGLGGIMSSQGALLFYEPFDYTAGTSIDGQAPALGAASGWVDTSSGTGTNGTGQDMTVRASGTTGGTHNNWAGIPGSSAFPNAGGYAEGERRNDNEAHIALTTTVTNAFTDGSTIWLSFVAAATTVDGQADNHHKPNVAIGEGALLDDRAQLAAGEAVGGGVAHDTSAGNPRARYWDDENTGGVYEDFLGNTLSRITPEELFIVRIDFGSIETITTAVFALDPYTTLTEADFNAATQSTITTNNDLNNEGFDTLSFHGSRTNYDEIRIATTFDEAIGIPEPGTLSLIGAALGLAALRRRRS